MNGASWNDANRNGANRNQASRSDTNRSDTNRNGANPNAASLNGAVGEGLAADPRRNLPALLALLAAWCSAGWLRPLDLAFARFLATEVPTAAPLAILAAALASHQLGRGHACLDLAATLADPGLALSLPPEGRGAAGLPLPAALLAGTPLTAWQAALADPELVSAGAGVTPLVLQGERLYLRRYWQYEQGVRQGIAARLEAPLPLDLPALAASLRALYGGATPAAATPDWQQLACALAARRRFAIITGGPGTGKTTTVVRLLAVLQALALAAGKAESETKDVRAEALTEAQPLRIRLAAPTGKAAARLNAAIANAVARLPLAGLAEGERIRRAIPLQVSTLHRLLGSRPDSRRFRHHAGQPLPLDVLVIDEASMVDLEMMAAVLEALPPTARLILLGDKDQLASVEAGAVLGELCRRAERGHYSEETANWLQAATGTPLPAELLDQDGQPLDQAVVMLRHSHRFGADSGIGQLAAAVNGGDLPALRRLLAQPQADLARWKRQRDGDPALERLLLDGTPPAAVAPAPLATGALATGRDAAVPARRGYRHYLQTMQSARPASGATQAEQDHWAAAVLAAHGEFQLLCALRRGPWGVEGLNRRVAELLHRHGLIPATEGWYPGRPVLVTRNDYGLGLMNGDIGITLALARPDGRDSLRVAFPAADGQGIHWVQPSRLQAVETVFALTVHKSQGSEFTHAALLLPEQLNPILTRELIYTGITRARQAFTLLETGPRDVLEQGVARRVLRGGGVLQPG